MFIFLQQNGAEKKSPSIIDQIILDKLKKKKKKGFRKLAWDKCELETK